MTQDALVWSQDPVHSTQLCNPFPGIKLLWAGGQGSRAEHVSHMSTVYGGSAYPGGE